MSPDTFLPSCWGCEAQEEVARRACAGMLKLPRRSVARMTERSCQRAGSSAPAAEAERTAKSGIAPRRDGAVRATPYFGRTEREMITE